MVDNLHCLRVSGIGLIAVLGFHLFFTHNSNAQSTVSTGSAAVTDRVITELFTFPCPPEQSANCSEGYAPNVLIQASDGNFYGAAGLTTQGNNPGGGTLFKITSAGQFTLLFTFSSDENGNFLNGDNPAVSLIEANDGFLYGVTSDGGATNNGVLFRIGKNGKNFQVMHNFCSDANCADGNSPISLILGQDGKLYGVTVAGGAISGDCVEGCGTIFRFTPPSTFTTLLAFNGTTQGASPGSIVQGADGNFYGVAGAEVFRFSLSGQFTPLTIFSDVNGFLPTASSSGLVEASNGELYGALTTYSINQAQFYTISPSGKGFHKFPSIGTISVDSSIASPIQADDGNLWTDFIEESAPNGILVGLSPAGAVVHDFQFDGTNGSLPEAGVLQAADGKLYGTTIGGGLVSAGKQPSGTIWVLDASLPAPPATVAAFTPASGAAATKVLIRGSHFIGTKEVTFNGVSASFTVLNTEFISATVPQNATSGPIAVTNEARTTVSATHFTVP